MREVRVAYYKASWRSWTDALISGWTLLFNWFTKSYSHVEIGFFIDGKWVYFSSSIRDGGTRWKSEKELLKNPDRWDIVTREYPDDFVERMIDRAKAIEGKPYDKLGIVGFVSITGQILNLKGAWYCSEAVWYILTGMWLKRISPRRLSKRLINLFRPT